MPHINDLIDLVVTCFIAKEGKTLLLDHKKLKTWLPVGGHVELHQTVDEAMDAEIKEEAGIPVEFFEPFTLPAWPKDLKIEPPHNPKRLRTPWAVEIHDFPGVPTAIPGQCHRHQALVYFARGLDWYVKLEEAHNAIRWFDIDALEELHKEGKVIDTIWWYAKQSILIDRVRP